MNSINSLPKHNHREYSKTLRECNDFINKYRDTVLELE